MRILLADDDAVMRQGLQVQLQRWGYEPVVCEDGEEADFSHGVRPDCLEHVRKDFER
jgi:DNA-binding response OmpR family regulator